MDSGTPIPLGEYVFYVLAVLIGVAWLIDFIVQIAANKAPDPAITGLVGLVMGGFVTIPRAFRRGRNGGD